MTKPTNSEMRRAGMQNGFNRAEELNVAELFPIEPGADKSSSLRLIDPAQIDELDNVRTIFDEESMADLRESVKELKELGGGIDGTGILQALVVARSERGEKPFVLIAGARRLRAARGIDLPRVPAVVVSGDAATHLVTQILENLQRVDISPLDEAVGFEKLKAVRNLSIRKLANTVGKDKGYVENRLNLLKIGKDVQALVEARPDTISSALIIDAVKEPKARKEIIARVADGAKHREVQEKVALALARTAPRPVVRAPVAPPKPIAPDEGHVDADELEAISDAQEAEEIAAAAHEQAELERQQIRFDEAEAPAYTADTLSYKLGTIESEARDALKQAAIVATSAYYDTTARDALKTHLARIMEIIRQTDEKL